MTISERVAVHIATLTRVRDVEPTLAHRLRVPTTSGTRLGAP